MRVLVLRQNPMKFLDVGCPQLAGTGNTCVQSHDRMMLIFDFRDHNLWRIICVRVGNQRRVQAFFDQGGRRTFANRVEALNDASFDSPLALKLREEVFVDTPVPVVPRLARAKPELALRFAGSERRIPVAWEVVDRFPVPRFRLAHGVFQRFVRENVKKRPELRDDIVLDAFEDAARSYFTANFVSRESMTVISPRCYRVALAAEGIDKNRHHYS